MISVERKNSWAVILGLVPYKDGDAWFVLYGDDLQEGISGNGRTPEEAIRAFDMAMSSMSGAYSYEKGESKWTPRK